MSSFVHALKPHRVRRFGQVARSEGMQVAIGRAASHLRMLASGLGRGTLKPRNPGSASRFAFGALWADLAGARAFHVTPAPAINARHRAVAMIGDLNLPQCRKYRVEQMDEIWAEHGVGYRYAHYEDVPRCREILQTATHLVLYRVRRCDLVSMYLYEARRLGLPVLYDIDDPLFSVSAYGGYTNMAEYDPALRRHFLDEAPLYLDAMNAADALSLSTPGLVGHARRYSSRPAFLRRNFADAATLEAGARARRAAVRREGFTVVLASGSRGHDADVDRLRESLCAFLTGGAGRWLTILGELSKDRFPKDLHPYITVRRFNGYNAYLADLAAADCLLLPLADDPFNQCKSAARAIDAAAVSVPTLASAVGDLPSFVEDGKTGLLLGDEDWGTALESLAACPGEAQVMGTLARRGLEGRWTARARHPVTDPDLVRWVREPA